MSKSYVAEFFSNDRQIDTVLRNSLRKAEDKFGHPFQEFTPQEMESYAYGSLSYQKLLDSAFKNTNLFRSHFYRYRQLLNYLDWLCEHGYISQKDSFTHPVRALCNAALEQRRKLSSDTNTKQAYKERQDDSIRNVLFFSLEEYKAYCAALFPDENTFIHIRASMDLLWLGLTIQNISELKRTAFHDGDPGQAYIECPAPDTGDVQKIFIQDLSILTHIRHLVTDDEVLVKLSTGRRANQYNVYQWEESDYLVRTIKNGKRTENTRNFSYLIHLSDRLKKHQDRLGYDSPWRNKKISCESLRISGKFCSLYQQNLPLEQTLQEAARFSATCATMFCTITYTDWLAMVPQ